MFNIIIGQLSFTIDFLGLVSPRVALDGSPLPSARLVSTIASGQTEIDERRFTSMLVGFGQFLDHDFDHVPVSRSESGIN